MNIPKWKHWQPVPIVHYFAISDVFLTQCLWLILSCSFISPFFMRLTICKPLIVKYFRWEKFWNLFLLSGARFSKVPRTFRARKAIRKTTTYLFCKAGLLICFKGNKNKNNCKVSCFETHSVLKVQRELCHPKYARKVSGLSRNRPLDWKVFGFFHVQVHPFAWSPVVRLLWKLGQAGILIPVWKLSRSETRSHIFYSIVHRQMVLTCFPETGIDSGIYWKPKK